MLPAVDPALFKGLKYRLVGPSRGGRVTTVTGVPSQPRTFYMGVASGGVFRTTDGGANWVPITDGKVPVGSTGDRSRSPNSDPKIIYLGTGSDGVRSNVSTGRGVYKTTDGGETWTFAGLYNAGQIGAVRIHPDQSRHRVGLGHGRHRSSRTPSAASSRRSTAARPGRRRCSVSDTAGAMDVELQPGNPNVVYAWMSRLERKPWTIISGCERRRLLQEHRRRRALHEDHRRPAGRVDRQGQPRGHRGEARSHLRADRGEARRRHVSLGRCGADVDGAALSGRDGLPAVLLHDDRRRSDQRRRGLWRRRRLLEIDRRRQDVHVDAHAAHRQPRHLDQPEGRQHHDPGERRRRQRLVRRRPHLVVADEPADVGALRRVDGRAVPLQDLRARSRTTAR